MTSFDLKNTSTSKTGQVVCFLLPYIVLCGLWILIPHLTGHPLFRTLMRPI